MNRVINGIKSTIRSNLNAVRRDVVHDPLTKKKISILYHNAQALFDVRGNTQHELFDYKRIISGRHNYYCNELYYGNTYYGHASILRNYSHYPRKINACIEHGLHFGETVFADQAIDSGLNGLITFSDKRLETLNPIAKVSCVAIGPYIHYADTIISEAEIQELKKKNGRTLLVFPSHSIDRVDAEYDIDSFKREIGTIRREKKIDHVIVCLFYKDILLDRGKPYEEEGYQVVCNGYRCDPLFLRRLKTFILLSDYTMSNDVGTNVGYCVYLEKPHYIFNQEIARNAYTQKDMENVASGNALEKEVEEVKKAFSMMLDSITLEQKLLCEKYWGFNHIMQPDVLNKVLSGFE